MEQLSLQRDLVTCMQEIRKNGLNSNSMYHVQAQCSALAAELIDILGSAGLNEQISELVNVVQHHEQMTERFSRVLYASEKSREQLAAKVQTFEFETVSWMDQTKALTAEKQELEASLGKCNRQFKFLQMQNETQSACLESAEAKLKEAHSESLINNEALHTAELRLKQVLADTQTLRNELMIAKKETQHFKEEAARAEEKLNELQNELISFQEQLQGSHEDWVMQTLSVQQQVEPLQRELEATQQDLVPLQQELEDTLRELVEAQQSRDFHAAKMASMKDGMDKMHQTLLRLQPIEMKRVTNPFENDKLDVSEEPHILDHDQTQRLLKQDLDTVTAERDALKIDLEQVTRERDSLQTQVKQEKAQVIKVTMDLDFSEAGEEGSLQRTAFEKDVMNDLAQASGVPTSTFSIKRLSSGSIIVETYVMPNSAGIDPRAIVADLVQQAKDPCSSLRSGKVTSKTVGVAAVQPSSPSRFGHGFASDELEKANSNLTQAKEEVEVKNDEINDLKQQLAYLKQLSQETLAAALQVDQSETISGMNKELAEHTEAWEGQMSTELNKEDSAHYLQPPSTNTSAPQITVASRGVDIAGQESETGGDSQPSIHEFLRKCKHVEELDEALLSRSRQVEELEIKLKEVLDQLETKTKQLEQLNNLNTQNSVELEAIQVQLEELQGQQQDLAQRAVIAELGKKATEKENDNIADLLKNAQQELQFAISARDSTMHSLEAMTSERDGLTMQIEEKDVKILDLSAKWNDSLQQLQVIVAWATSEKAGLQDQLDEACNSLRASQSNCEQRIEAERLRLEKNIENERLRVTELMGKLSIEAAQGQGIQSHVNHLEKVSSDLQNLYQQTGEINAMKKELVDKNACLSELESLVTDQYTAALKQAEILEALLELSGQLDSRVTASQSSFEKMKEDCAKAQLAAAISTRAWQTEQAERVLVFKALLELAGPEMGNAMDVTVQDVDLTVQHVESLLTQIMDDRTMVLGEIQVMAAQLSSAQNEIEQKNGIIEEVESLLSESRNRMEQLEVSLNVSQRRYEEELRASQRMHHDQLEKMMNLLSNEKKNMWESKENEIASLQGAVEESALIAEEIHMVLDESWQKERKAKDEAVSNLEAKIAELAVVGVKLQNEQEKNASLVSEVQLLQKQIAELAAAEGDLGKAHAQEANAASETIKELQEKLALSESQRFLANRDAQDALAASSEHEKEKKLILTTIATNQVAIESLEQTINVLTIDLERKRAETDTLQMEIQRQQEKLVLADKSLSRALFLSAADLKQDAGVDDAYAELSKDASRDFSARVREEKVNAELELARLDSCEKDILGMKEMVEAMQAEKASMERQNQELQERNQEDQKEIARLREDYRSAQGELKKLHQSGTHFSAPVSSEGETVQQLQPQTNDKAMGSESILALEAQVERLEKEGAEMSAECEQLQAALANAQAQRRTAIENAEKAQAEADALRQELYEMRSGAADIVPLGKVEGLEAKVSKLQLFVSELQNKAKEDALNLELLRASEGAATARSKDSENKLVETERAMLACVAEEARLIEEIEAGQNREQELEARLSMLIGIRDPVHVPMPKEHVAKS